MDLLNLDELVELERQVTIRGKNYSVVERSIGVLLDSIVVAKNAAKSRNKPDEAVFFENMLKTIRTILPECPEEVVRGLTMPQMVAILQFCNQDPAKMAEQAVAEGNGVSEVEPGKA